LLLVAVVVVPMGVPVVAVEQISLVLLMEAVLLDLEAVLVLYLNLVVDQQPL